MATINLSLTDTMKRWVEGQAETGSYDDAGDYVRDLIRRDQERAGRIAAMQGLVDEALIGGPSARSTADILAAARREVGRGSGGL